jgi:AraC family transcriptional regulator, ethanolamine operon transcriptional activator
MLVNERRQIHRDLSPSSGMAQPTGLPAGAQELTDRGKPDLELRPGWDHHISSVRVIHRYFMPARIPPSIRKVQAMAIDQRIIVPATPFPAGLALARSFRDPDEMVEQALYWGMEPNQLGRGRFKGSFRGVHSGRIQMNVSRRNQGLLLRGSIPNGAVVLSSVHRRSAPVFYRGAALADHHVMLAQEGDEVDFRSQGGDEQITVAVYVPVFDELARATLGPRFFDDKASDRLALRDPQFKPRLDRRLFELLEQGMTQSARLSDPEYSRTWEFQVLDAWLADVAAPDVGFTPAMRHRAGREAEAFLRENLDRPVSVAELCLVTGVPKRTLMLGFSDCFGIPPLAFHKRLRLNASRRELAGARPGETTVTDVALRWGFDHFGRFSVDYRLMFGESPIDTLRG